MLQKIKKQLIALAVSAPLLLASLGSFGVAVTVGVATSGTVFATCGTNANVECPDTGVCSGASNLQLGTNANNQSAADDCTGQDQTSKVNSLISTILNIFSVIVGIIAVVMIIYAGFKYISSGGKEESVKTAKNTILYAIIGLVIVALAQLIVKFVLSKAANPATTN